MPSSRVVAVLVATVVAGCGAAKTDTPSAGPVLISARTGAIHQVSGIVVRSAVADGNGGWFVCGDRLARLRPDGTVDSSWSADFSIGRRCDKLIRYGSHLYVYEGNLVDAFATSDGQHLWTSPRFSSPGEFGGVYSLAANGSVLYAAGHFTRVGRVHRAYLAEFDANTGRLLDSPRHSEGYGTEPGSLSVVALAGKALFVGGSFAKIDGHERSNIAKLDVGTEKVSAWEVGITRFYLNGVGDVETIFAANRLVFTAGHDGFGVASIRTGKIARWMYSITGTPTTFGSAGRIVYIGGGGRNGFTTLDGVARNNLAAIDTMTGRVTAWAPNFHRRYVLIHAIVPSGDSVVVLGEFVDSIG